MLNDLDLSLSQDDNVADIASMVAKADKMPATNATARKLISAVLDNALLDEELQESLLISMSQAVGLNPVHARHELNDFVDNPAKPRD